MAQSVSTSVTLKVPYYDVDLMQIVWHGNYLKYFEVARQALFREYGVDLQSLHGGYEVCISDSPLHDQAYLAFEVR